MSDVGQSKAIVTALGELLEKQMKKLQTHSDEDYKAITRQGDWNWYRPEKEGWEGDLFDFEDMLPMWIRQQHEEEFDAALASADTPGTSGDLAVSTLQGDMLGCMERAFRSRHRTSVRNKVHASARRYGHGHENGTIKMCMVNYIERLIKQSNS